MKMENTRLILDEKGHGGLFYMEKEETLGEMELEISGQLLTVFHTEVKPQAEGRGIAKKLLAALVDHARKNGLSIVPLCPFVHAQFKRHPEEYGDVWKK